MAEKRLTGQVAIVTGGRSGIGQGAVHYLLFHGARVAAVDIRDGPSGEDADLLHIQCDVAREDEVESAVVAVVAHWHRVDVLVNCAGVLDHFAAVGDTTTSDWKRCFAVNVDGPMFFLRACMPHFLAQASKGSIVNFCSTASVRGAACGAAYTASKHALLGLSRSTAWMYAREGVRCNSLLLGPTAGTNITKTEREPDGFGLERIRGYGSLVPRYLQVDDVMESLLHLITAKSVNGAELAVDGGFLTA